MSDSRTSKELISELRALDLPGVAPIARAAAAEIERLQATNVPKNGDVYLALVRSGYSQHEAHEIASMVESMQCQRHDCEVMRDELQELRAVHEPKALRASIEGLAEAYERQSSISAAHGGHSAEAWQTVADDLRSLLEQEGAAVPPSALQQELAVTNKLLDERNRLLDAIPECPQHGRQCIPHAIEWVQKRATVPPSDERAEKALRNCMLLAMRQLRAHKNHEYWKAIIRFCEEGGVSPSPLRSTETKSEKP